MSTSLPITLSKTVISPESNNMNPHMLLNKTVFPLPFLPIIPYILPLYISSETSFSTTCSPNFYKHFYRYYQFIHQIISNTFNVHFLPFFKIYVINIIITSISTVTIYIIDIGLLFLINMNIFVQ